MLSKLELILGDLVYGCSNDFICRSTLTHVGHFTLLDYEGVNDSFSNIFLNLNFAPSLGPSLVIGVTSEAGRQPQLSPGSLSGIINFLKSVRRQSKIDLLSR